MLSFNYQIQSLNMIPSQFHLSSNLIIETQIKNYATQIDVYVEMHRNRQCFKHGVLLQ